MDNEKRLKKPFKKESKLDDTRANVKEGENTNQRSQHSKARATFAPKSLRARWTQC